MRSECQKGCEYLVGILSILLEEIWNSQRGQKQLILTRGVTGQFEQY